MGCQEERYMLRNEEIDKAKDKAELGKVCLKLKEFFKNEEPKVKDDPACKNYTPEQIQQREELMKTLDFDFGVIEDELKKTKDTLPLPELKEKMQVLYNLYYLAYPKNYNAAFDACLDLLKKHQ